MQPPLHVRRVDADAVIDLRHRVLWPDRPRADVILPEDGGALHLAGCLGAQIVAVGSFFPEITPEGTRCRLRKLAVDPGHRGRGLASALLRAAMPYLQEMGCTELWCDARLSAAGFYRANGFTLAPDTFTKRGLPYVIARRPLRQTQAPH